ncbi:MAG: sigma-70 family RNA polymerase sigma factor [Oscillospiraceae bacterium]|nr:sigma-70 family RNA polymerase sigma factor [Oscillospiraceae bacterium]
MPKFRTPKNNRPTYIYRDAYGRKIAELRPGENGVTEAYINALHRADDDEQNAAKKDSYYGVFHYEQINDDGEDFSDEKQPDLADYAADPETQFFEALETAERSGAIKAAWDSLQPQQRDLILKKLLKRTNVSIADEEGVSEAAVRNRLAKIQKKFEEFLK